MLFCTSGVKPGNFFVLLDAGLKACSTLVTCLAFQVGVDPLFDFLAAVVGGIETDAQSLALVPGHDAADVHTRQSEQGKEISTLVPEGISSELFSDMPPELTSRLEATKRCPSGLTTLTSVIIGIRA